MNFRSSLGFILGLVTLARLPAAEITADRMAILNSEQGKVTVFEDNVTISDGGTRISAGKVEFYDQQNLAVIHGGNVSITTPNASIQAESAEYQLGAQRMFLYRNVLIRHQQLQIAGSALVLDNVASLVSTDAEVQVRDDQRGIFVSGQGGSFDLASEAGMIRGAPRFELLRDSRLVITSDEMYLSSSRNIARSIGNVRANTADALLTADTLDYFIDQDSALARGLPVLTHQENRVTGEQMAFHFAQGELQRIEVRGTSRNCPQLIRALDQLRGEKINIELQDGQLATIDIQGDSLQQPELHRKSNIVRGDRIEFQFHQGELEQLRLLGRTSARYFTDDGDRIEVSGSGTEVRFRDGEAYEVIVHDVPQGRLFRNAGPARLDTLAPRSSGTATQRK
ncbi:MAG: LptA/OstA family protein [candidate division WOR-3 bacterium]